MEDLLPSLDKMEQETALQNVWTRARYGNRGVLEPLNMCEQTFFDVLCRELGVRAERKRGLNGLFRVDCWVRENSEPYRARDYWGLVEEFLGNVCGAKGEKIVGEYEGDGESDGRLVSEKGLPIAIKESGEGTRLMPVCYRMGRMLGGRSSQKGNRYPVQLPDTS